MVSRLLKMPRKIEMSDAVRYLECRARSTISSRPRKPARTSESVAKVLVAGLAGFVLTTLTAQAAPEAGRDYRVIEPAQSTEDPGRIEVVEVFSYACPHCNDLNPLIHKWAAKLLRDVPTSSGYRPISTRSTD